MSKGKLFAFLTPLMFVLLYSANAFAQGAAADNKFTTNAMLAIGAALSMGLAGAGAALGQGRAAASALEGIARTPGAQDKVQTPLILSLAFMEALGIFAFVIAILMVMVKMG